MRNHKLYELAVYRGKEKETGVTSKRFILSTS